MSGVAQIHPNATLTPGKLELLAAWLPSQEWFGGDPADLHRVAFFRFADPDGEVGLDCMLIASAGMVYHVPVTWRSEPFPDGDLIGTLEHSVLGTRYCFDAATDPVYVSVVSDVIRNSGTDADIVAVGETEARQKLVLVQGSGLPFGTKSHGTLQLMRALDGAWPDAVARMAGTWEQDGRGRTDILAVLD